MTDLMSLRGLHGQVLCDYSHLQPQDYLKSGRGLLQKLERMIHAPVRAEHDSAQAATQQRCCWPYESRRRSTHGKLHEDLEGPVSLHGHVCTQAACHCGLTAVDSLWNRRLHMQQPTAQCPHARECIDSSRGQVSLIRHHMDGESMMTCDSMCVSFWQCMSCSLASHQPSLCG